MNEQVQKLPEKAEGHLSENQITLTDLFRYAEPLLKQWTESENEKHRRELEYETNLLQITAKQNRLMTIGLITLISIVLIIAGMLFYNGKDSSATDLIKLIAGLGGAAFGGYGWAMRRRQADEDDF